MTPQKFLGRQRDGKEEREVAVSCVQWATGMPRVMQEALQAPVLRLGLLHWEEAELGGRKEKAFRGGRDYCLEEVAFAWVLKDI